MSMDEHLLQARIENAEFLMDECGMTLEMAAARLGVSKNTLETNFRRAGKKVGA